MIQYLDLLRHVLEHGKFKADRTGTGTFSVFGAQIRCPLRESFPLLTTKKVHTKSIIYELRQAQGGPATATGKPVGGVRRLPGRQGDDGRSG